jgi:hypothetical protein
MGDNSGSKDKFFEPVERLEREINPAACQYMTSIEYGISTYKKWLPSYAFILILHQSTPFYILSRSVVNLGQLNFPS